MPRLTTKTYIERHRHLRHCWLYNQSALAVLSPEQQAALYRYYQPGQELTPVQLQVHRAQITCRESSLPQRASKAYAQMLRTAKQPSTTSPVRQIKIIEGIVYGVQPLKMRKVAQACIRLAKLHVKQQRERQ